MPIALFLTLTLTAAEPPRLSVGVDVGYDVALRLQADFRRGEPVASLRLASGDRSAALYPRAPVALRSRGVRLETEPEGEPTP